MPKRLSGRLRKNADKNKSDVQSSVERKAQKKLSKIPEPYYSNLKTAILDLGNNPRPSGCKKLKDRDLSYPCSRLPHYLRDTGRHPAC